VAKPQVSGTKMVRAPGKPTGKKARKGPSPQETVNPLDPELEQRKKSA
jgi:hypothetical protein